MGTLRTLRSEAAWSRGRSGVRGTKRASHRPRSLSLRMIFSCAVSDIWGQSSKSWGPKSESRMQLLLLDISQAYFNAKTDPEKPTYVQLPEEIGAPPGTCVATRKHVYDTQGAAEG